MLKLKGPKDRLQISSFRYFPQCLFIVLFHAVTDNLVIRLNWNCKGIGVNGL